MNEFPIILPGEPIPQGSHSVNRRTGHLFDANPRLKTWRKNAGTVLDQYIGTWFGAWEPYDGPLHVEAIFYMKRATPFVCTWCDGDGDVPVAEVGLTEKNTREDPTR